MARYPSPERIALPPPDTISPDQKYHEGWEVNYTRMFLILVLSMGLNVFQALWGFQAASRFQPSVQLVTLDGGYLVAWNERGEAVIDSVSYVPARLRALSRQFLDNRYEYDYQNIQKIQSALNLMSPEAQREETAKLQRLNLGVQVVAPKMKVELKPNLDEMNVRPLGDGTFEVSIEGDAEINDAARWPDPDNPLSKPFTVTFTVKTVPATENNPLGYEIVSTGRDNIL